MNVSDCKAHKEMEKEYQLGDNSFDRLKEIASKIKKEENTKNTIVYVE